MNAMQSLTERRLILTHDRERVAHARNLLVWRCGDEGVIDMLDRDLFELDSRIEAVEAAIAEMVEEANAIAADRSQTRRWLQAA